MTAPHTIGPAGMLGQALSGIPGFDAFPAPARHSRVALRGVFNCLCIRHFV